MKLITETICLKSIEQTEILLKKRPRDTFSVLSKREIFYALKTSFQTKSTGFMLQRSVPGPPAVTPSTL